jgi:hypothetical protein
MCRIKTEILLTVFHVLQVKLLQLSHTTQTTNLIVINDFCLYIIKNVLLLIINS